MTRGRRWALVLAALVVLLALPPVVSALPAGRSSVTAAQLVDLIRGSGSVAFSGYAESTGELALPVTDQFNSVSDLFGGTTDLRVWWRGTGDWRVDDVSLTGETDLHYGDGGTWSWDYESDTATFSPVTAAPAVRLPVAQDLVPATVARRLLGTGSAGGYLLSRLPDARVAGQDAAGLRLQPTAAQATISHVDIWAIPSSGLAVRVAVYGRGSSMPVLATSMLDLSTSMPAAADTAFTPPPGAKIRYEQQPDIVAALDKLGHRPPPAQLGGLPRELAAGLGAVGVYGFGVTLLTAIPLTPNLAATLTRELGGTVGAGTGSTGIAIGVGPLNLLLTPRRRSGAAWLLAGTVTAASLQVAAKQLAAETEFYR